MTGVVVSQSAGVSITLDVGVDASRRVVDTVGCRRS